MMNAIFERIVERLDVGVHVVDATGKTFVYNQKMCELEGMNKKDVLHKNIKDIFHFQEHDESTLLHSLTTEKEIVNVKQTYFNNKGNEITTVNKTFPIIIDNELIAAVEIATDVTKMERLIRSKKLKQDGKMSFHKIIGNSHSLLDVIELAKRATRTNSNVLIIGETGTGKELFAQSIHNESERANKPFISQNCAALPDTLMESILFGTAKGAFTGAMDTPGLFEQAAGGTLLLDELNSLNIALQAKLLRVLQEKRVRRIGDTKEIPIDVRIIAIVNEDPIDAISSGRLRKDLYYRLAVITLSIPSLRERLEDLPILIDHFINHYNQLFSMSVEGVSEDVLNLFQQHHWPGNVRELEHVIEAAMNLMLHEKIITYENLPYQYRNEKVGNKGKRILTQRYKGHLVDQLAQFEKEMIEEVLAQEDYHITNTALQLGLSRQSLQYRMRRLQIRGDK